MKKRHICDRGWGALAQGTAMVSPALGRWLGLGLELLPLVLWQRPPNLCHSWAAWWHGAGLQNHPENISSDSLDPECGCLSAGKGGVNVPHQLGLVISSGEVWKVLGGSGEPP